MAANKKIFIGPAEGGKFVETWSSYDALGLIQQIGAVPLSGAAQA